MADEEGTITLGEVVALQDHLEESAVAVLGAADDKNCTYSQGYVRRQALYACLTCTPEICDPAGFCLACNYHCHEGHNVVELYTKRNFRCDCGNEKFGEKKCNLELNKDRINIENIYNQNFKGKYCTCSRPYPDDEDDVQDDMIQCSLCEDWFHGRHLNVDEVPNDYCEMICISCVEKYKFLNLYPDILVKIFDKKESNLIESSEEKEKNSESFKSEDNSKPNEEASKTSSNDSSTSAVPNIASEETSRTSSSSATQTNSTTSSVAENKTKQNETYIPQCSNKESTTANSVETSNEKPKSDDLDIETVLPKECLIQDKDVSIPPTKISALFLQDGWRSQLCICNSCVSLYKENNISFITDATDMVEVYEKKGLDTPAPNRDADLAFLSTLDRTQQVEIISEYNDMKEKLVEYLKQFGENKKVVKAEDIHKFFSGLHDVKRRRLNDSAPPGFCR